MGILNMWRSLTRVKTYLLGLGILKDKRQTTKYFVPKFVYSRNVLRQLKFLKNVLIFFHANYLLLKINEFI